MDPVLTQNLIEALLLAVVGLLAYVLRQVAQIGITYLQQKLGLGQLLQIKEFAQTIVRTLAQSPAFENLDPLKKKELAVVEISRYCSEHNIPLDMALIDRVIEEAVQIMKSEIGKIDWSELEPGTSLN